MNDPIRQEPPVLLINVTCEEAEPLLSRMIDGELSDEQALVVQTHLAQCEACMERYNVWQEQSSLLGESLSRELNPRKPAESGRAVVRRVRQKKPGHWVPIGVVVSQGFAIVALAVFMGGPVNAPAPVQSSQRERPREEPAIHIEKISRSPGLPHQTYSVSTIGDSPVTEPLPEVAVDYSIAAHGEQPQDENGKMVLLGDVGSGGAIIRLIDDQGNISEARQAEIDRVFSAAECVVVRRFLNEIERPEVRARLEELSRMQRKRL